MSEHEAFQDDLTAYEIRDELQRLSVQKAEAESRREVAMKRIGELILHGRALNLPVNEMAVLAGISRETAHKFIRDQGR